MGQILVLILDLQNRKQTISNKSQITMDKKPPGSQRYRDDRTKNERLYEHISMPLLDDIEHTVINAVK